MRSHVLADARLAKQAGRFVWLEVDYERERNAGFVERFPVDAFPSFLVVDPATEEVVLRWLGSADVPRLEKFLADARAAMRRRKPRRDLEARVLDLSVEGRGAECARAAAAGAPGLPRGRAFANVAGTGLGCALGLPEKQKGRPALVAALEPLAQEALALPALPADDRAGLFDLLVGARREAGDEPAARALAERWWRFLEEEAERAPTPEGRAFLDSSRLAAAAALEEPARAIPALERSARELPEDYNPHVRLATLYRDAGRLEEALGAADRALGLAYGPRKLRVYQVRATILEALGRREALEENLEQAVAYGDRLPVAQLQGSSAVAHERMRKHLAQLRGSN